MRYLLSARVQPEQGAELLRALQDGRFGDGFPYGDLGDVVRAGRVDPSGTIRWVEVCYCREAYGVALEEELPYFEPYLTDITIADARNPDHCQGYPACGSCDCTNKVRPKGEPLIDYLERTAEGPARPAVGESPRPTRWLGWRGRLTSEEQARNRAGRGLGSGD